MDSSHSGQEEEEVCVCMCACVTHVVLCLDHTPPEKLGRSSFEGNIGSGLSPVRVTVRCGGDGEE